MSLLALLAYAVGGGPTDPPPSPDAPPVWSVSRTIAPVGPTPPTAYERTDTGVKWVAKHSNGTAFGVDYSTGELVSTTDAVGIRGSGLFADDLWGAGRIPSDMTFGGGYAWVQAATYRPEWPSHPEPTSKIMRAPVSDLSTWTDVTPPGWQAGTFGFVSTMAHDGTSKIVIGQYGYEQGFPEFKPRLHRSQTNGATWSFTYANPNITNTRHVHAVHWHPTDGSVWMTLGDSPGFPRGVYRSFDSGATWVGVAHNHYPIDFGWLPDGTFVGEGDGLNTPHITTLAPGAATLADAITPAMAQAATGQADWRGTARNLLVLGADKIFYATTAEGGNTGTRYGLWTATRSGGVWTPSLLEELPQALNAMGRTVKVGNYLLAYRWRIALP